MTEIDTRQDGGAMDPRVARVLLRHREEVAQATERAYRELRRLGVPDAAELLVGDLDKRGAKDPAVIEAAIDRAADRLMARLALRYG